MNSVNTRNDLFKRIDAAWERINTAKDSFGCQSAQTVEAMADLIGLHAEHIAESAATLVQAHERYERLCARTNLYRQTLLNVLELCDPGQLPAIRPHLAHLRQQLENLYPQQSSQDERTRSQPWNSRWN